MVREFPILFSQEMVTAILQDRKTVTRRIIKPQPDENGVIFMPTAPCLDWEQIYGEVWKPYSWNTPDGDSIHKMESPKGKVGDLLYVRETWAETCDEWGTPIIAYKAGGNPFYIGPQNEILGTCDTEWDIDNYPSSGRWKPGIHLPKKSSRIWLELAGIKVERVADISQEQAKQEGVHPLPHRPSSFDCKKHQDGSLNRDCYCCAFKVLWNKINGDAGYSWDINPWVWCLSFKVLSKIGRPQVS